MTNPEEDSNHPSGRTSGGGAPESDASPTPRDDRAPATADDMVDEFSDGEENEPPRR